MDLAGILNVLSHHSTKIVRSFEENAVVVIAHAMTLA
jgi:hypothetical protein